MLASISRSALRLAALLLPVALLAGCASNTIRGQLNYDVRPADQRPSLVWPQPPDKPRYRYAGELIGEPNFSKAGNTQSSLVTALKWVAGLFDDEEPVMLQRPQHGMTDEKGRVYVVDAGRSALMVFDPNPPADSDSDKDGGQLLQWTALGPGVALGTPVAVTQVWNGDLAVSDARHGVVFRINTKGELVAVLGGNHLQRPTGLAFDSKTGLLFVADTVANDIKVYDATGDMVNTFGGPGEKDGNLNGPTLMTFADNTLYVTDTLNSRVQVYDAQGIHLRSFGERGLNLGNMARPKGIAVADGIVYAVESYYSHLLIYNQQGELLLGINGTGMKDDRFLLPSGVWTDNKDKIYLADMFNGRVVVFQFLGNKDE